MRRVYKRPLHHAEWSRVLEANVGLREPAGGAQVERSGTSTPWKSRYWVCEWACLQGRSRNVFFLNGDEMAIAEGFLHACPLALSSPTCNLGYKIQESYSRSQACTVSTYKFASVYSLPSALKHCAERIRSITYNPKRKENTLLGDRLVSRC